MGLCAATGFASVFLQNRGYSNSLLGLVLALGNAGAFFLSIALGGVVDRSKKLDAEKMLWILLGGQLLLILSFALFPGCSPLVSLCYGLYIAVANCVAPLLNQISFDLSTAESRINYGLGRGMGSLAFAVASAVLGVLAKKFGSEMLIAAGAVLTLFQMFSLFLLTNGRTKNVSEKKRGEKGASIQNFIRENRRFCLMIFGLAIISFSQRLYDNFIINPVRQVGGDVSDLGKLNAFMAMTELPAMFFYSRLSKRFGCGRCIRFGLICYTLKSAATAFASTLPQLYFACAFQGLSYALVTPAFVEYTALVVPKKDATRGQALSYSVTTLGGIFASLSGGLLYDALPVSTVLVVATFVSLLGLVLSLTAGEKTVR